MIDERYSVVFDYVAKGGKPMVLQTPVAGGVGARSGALRNIMTLVGAAAIRGVFAGFSKIPKKLPKQPEIKEPAPPVVKPPKGRYTEELEKQNAELQDRLARTESQLDQARSPLQQPLKYAPATGIQMERFSAIVDTNSQKKEIQKAIPLKPLKMKSAMPSKKVNINTDSNILKMPQPTVFKQAAIKAEPVAIDPINPKLPPTGADQLKGLKTDVKHRETMGDK